MAPPKGRKPKKWQDDAEVLARIATVSTMLLQGAKAFQIAEVMDYSIRTAWRDIERAHEVMKEEARGDIDQNRNRSIAQIREVQSRAWEQYRAAVDIKTKLIALKEIRECETEITALQGTKRPIGLDLTTKGDKLGLSASDFTDDELAAIAKGRQPQPSSNGHS